MIPAISVVIATRNRGDSVVRLLSQLNAQTLCPSEFEVVVVDDGSDQPIAPLLADQGWRLALQVLRIGWSGQGRARHEGASLARGRILVFLDDDMQVGQTFLDAQLARHAATPRAVVLGRIQPDPALRRMPLFERYHARQLDRWRRQILDDGLPVRGEHLCTGNVSMTRADYFGVGGFDPTLERSEDRELGIRLAKAGCTLVYADEVASVHSSDHTSLRTWLRRAYWYGRFDYRIASQHRDVPTAHPWAFWARIHPLSRPVVVLSLAAPRLGRAAARAAYAAAIVCDTVRATGAALTLTAFSYAFEYFAGLRDEYGSLRALLADLGARRPRRTGPVRRFCGAVRADHDAVRANREKYRGERIPRYRLGFDLFAKIGFQMLFVYRAMRLFDELHVPLVPMVLSRLIRHWYSAEIHWKTRIAPGVSIVHGVGLVLSHGAEVGEGCVLFHNVTLGESRDPRSGTVGAPRLGRNVHVGPGASLLGPISVGDGSKVAAGVVLMRSIAGGSLVKPPNAAVVDRRPTARFEAPALRMM